MSSISIFLLVSHLFPRIRLLNIFAGVSIVCKLNIEIETIWKTYGIKLMVYAANKNINENESIERSI